MKRIGWIILFTRRYGGNIYGDRVEKILTEEFDIERKIVFAKHIKWRYLKPFEWFVAFLGLRGTKDLWVAQSFLVVAAFSIARIKGKKMAIIYHLDNSVFPRILRPIFFLLEKIFYHNLRNVDAIEYWRQFFLAKGYPKVYKIYPGLHLPEFNISDKEVAEFKERYNLEEKAIVYIGNCQKEKGVVQAYEALKDLDVYLVTSGEERVKIPARNFNLDRKNFLRLLKTASVAVFMTRFHSGWDMTAQEAMLLKVPVIGVSRGGMKELFEKGGQIICDDITLLKGIVEDILAHSEKQRYLGEAGRAFAQDLTSERFAEEWRKLAQEVIRE